MKETDIKAPMRSAIPDSIKHNNMKGATRIVWIILLLGILTIAPAAALPDLLVSEVNAYHYADGTTVHGSSSKISPAWFNLTNYVDVTVENNGTTDAGAFHVSLYADGVLIAEQSAAGLSSGSNETLMFEWKPIGIDEQDGGSPHTYNMLAEADPYSAVGESDETNNNMTVGETVIYNGYMADEPLNTFAHGTLRGGLLFTTGDGNYWGETGPGFMGNVQYNVDIPPTSSVEMAKLNVYYTWAKLWSPYPDLRIEITNQTGTYELVLETAYHDRACSFSGFNLPWGNYVYDLGDYITGSGSYTVTIYNNGTGYQRLSRAGPGLVVLYSDDSMPQIEYWLAEGADVLMGGRRDDSGSYLALEECINNATFEGNIDIGRVGNAVLGTVSPWGESADYHANVLYFNGIELGRCVYDNGYDPIGDISLGSIRMTGTGAPQVGVNLSDVTGYLSTSVNVAGQGDDGDNMMPSNAFLVVEYEPEASAPFLISGRVDDSNGNPVNDPDVVITNTNTGKDLIAETGIGSDYYQAMTCSYRVSAGDVLSFSANGGTATSHTVTPAEMDAGGFEQNLTGPGRICGDVTGNDVVNTGDVILLSNYVGYTGYTLQNEWAGDVTGNGVINTGDVILLSNYVGYTGYSLNCTG